MTMTIANIAVSLILVAVLFLAVRKIVQDKKKGVPCSGCGGCPVAGQCEGSRQGRKAVPAPAGEGVEFS
jgi:hypothetical protein